VVGGPSVAAIILDFASKNRRRGGSSARSSEFCVD
jgi:hypothetical protein